MNNDIRDKAKALQESLGHPPWLQAIGVSEMGGEPAIFVYATERVPLSVVPDFWRGVKVWVRSAMKIRPANEGTG